MTSSQAPPWATPGYFADVAKKAKSPVTSSTPQAGNALSLRLQAPQKKAVDGAAVDVAKQRSAGRSLLQRVAHQTGVLGGHPLSAEDIAKLGTTIHLTREASVQPILDTGLRPTTNLPCRTGPPGVATPFTCFRHRPKKAASKTA